MKTITDVIKISKELTEKEMMGTILFVGDTAIDICFKDSEQKEALRQIARKLIHDKQIKKYWFASVAWMSKNLFVAPSNDPNRTEVLIVTEYDGVSLTSKMIVFPFEKQDGKIVWSKKQEMPSDHEDAGDAWNFYKEDVAFEKFDKHLEKTSIEFAEWILKQEKTKKGIKKIVKQYKQETGKTATEDEIKQIFLKWVKEGRIVPKDEDYKKFKKEKLETKE